MLARTIEGDLSLASDEEEDAGAATHWGMSAGRMQATDYEVSRAERLQQRLGFRAAPPSCARPRAAPA